MTEEAPRPRPVRYRDAPARKRRTFWLVVPAAVVLVLVVLVVVLGIASRAWAEQYVEDQVEQNLPEGVTGDVTAKIGGGPVVFQYLSGRFDDIALTSTDLAIAGVPVTAHLQATGVPTDLTLPVQHLTGTVSFGEDALQALLAAQGDTGTLTIADGGIQYRGTTKVLGFGIDYLVTAQPSLDGGVLHLEPTDARIQKGNIDLDASRLIRFVAPDGYDFCIAQYLPRSLSLDSVLVGAGGATVGLSGDGVLLDEDALADTGSCP